MNVRFSPVFASVVAALGLTAGSLAQLPTPAPVTIMRDQQDINEAEKAKAAGKYAEALKLYQGIPKNYPTSPFIPASNLGSAICYLFLKDYDKAVEAASRNFTVAKDKINPETLEGSYVLVPKIYLIKAQELPDTQATLQKKTYQDAIKGFEDLIAKFPNSLEVETALVEKGRAMGLVGNFEGADQSLQKAMEQFPKSASLMDTKYLRGLALAQKGISLITTPGAKSAEASAALDEAEKVFREIINARTDLALMNSSYMQLGEVFSEKAKVVPKDSDAYKKLNEDSLDLYRNVRSKEEILKAQEVRINFYINQADAARQKGELEVLRTNTRQVEKEREKLEELKSKPDQSLLAKLNSVKIYIALDRYDEARVVLRFTDGFLADEDKESKKVTAAQLAVTYAAQHVVDKAVEAYDKFKAAYKNDPVGENLALLVGMAFLDEDPKINNPEKAMKYFDEQVASYPDSKLSALAGSKKAFAYKDMGKPDQAIAALKDFIGKTKDPEMLVEAEFNLGLMLKELEKTEEAVAAFKTVREKYPNTQEAEQSAFWLANILINSGKPKDGLEEMKAFISKFPNSKLLANAMYFKARAQTGTGDTAGAVVTYKELIQKFPDAESAPAAFFDTAGIQQSQADASAKNGKADYSNARATMSDFIAKYPDNDRTYTAFSFSAQLFEKEEKYDEAVKKYEEYMAGHAGNPTVAKAHLAIATLYRTRAEKLGSFLSMGKADQENWTKWMDLAVKNAEQGIEKFPESDTVASLLEVLLKIETLRLNVGIKKEEDVKAYFTALSAKFASSKSTKAKTLFVLANFLAERDKQKKSGEWFGIMDAVYDPELIFSPSDLDRYGSELVNRDQLDKAQKVFEKLAKDYPVPPNMDPSKVTRSIGEAQSVAMAGRARILQKQGKGAEGQAIAEELKRLYKWSNKVSEADYQIAVGLIEQGKLDEGINLLSNVVKNTGGSVSLRANGMMQVAKALEKQGDYDSAINNYIKIATFFESERELAAEGLYRGAQILEGQASGKLPLATKPKPAPAKPTPAKPGATPKPGASPKPAEKK